MPDTIDLDTLSPSDNPHLSFGTVPTSPADPKRIEQIVRSTAAKYNLDPDYMSRIAKQESGFNPFAQNKDTGASGVMQLMPDTAKNLGVSNVFNPEENIDAGVRYYKQLLDQNNGDHVKAATLYGGFKTKDPTNYLKAIQPPGNAGTTGSPVTGDVIDLDKVQPPNIGGAASPEPGNLDKLIDTLKFASYGLLGPGIGQLVNPVERQYIKENLPAIGASVGASLVPGLEEFAPELALRAPLLTRTVDALGHVAGAYLGGVGGETGQKALAGENIDIGQILRNEGPQAALQAVVEAPGVLVPAAKLAASTYKKIFKPTPEEMRLGVLDTLQNEAIPARNSEFALAARKDTVNNQINDLIDSHTSQPGLVPPHYQPAQGLVPPGQPGATINLRDVTKRVGDEMTNLMGKKTLPADFKEEVQNYVQDFYNQQVGYRNGENIDLRTANDLKRDLREVWNPGVSDTRNGPQIRKALYRALDKEMEAKLPALKPLQDRLWNLINAEDAVKRAAVKTGSSMLNWGVARPLAMGALGAGAGMYTLHNPYQAAAIGVGAGLLSDPRNYARMFLMMKNNPELFKQLTAIGPRTAIQPGEENPVVNLKNAMQEYGGNQ